MKDTIKLFNYKKDNSLPTKEELFSRNCFSELTIPHFKENSRWILATKETQDKLNLFETRCSRPSSTLFDDNKLYRIGDYCDIGNGMVSGLDSAFQIKDIEKLNHNEQKALIDVFKAKDLNAYFNIGVTKYIFIQEEMTEDAFNVKYPHFVEHFKPNRKKLAERYSYHRTIPYWEFVFPRNQKLFERKEPRIFVPCKERISNKRYFRFCYAPHGCYPTQDVTAIFRKNSCKESIEYILAYLNNERVFSWLELNGIVKGAIVEFSETPIASIPFRPINWSSKIEVTVHNQITDEVKQYLADKYSKHIENLNSLFNILFNE